MQALSNKKSLFLLKRLFSEKEYGKTSKSKCGADMSITWWAIYMYPMLQMPKQGTSACLSYPSLCHACGTLVRMSV